MRLFYALLMALRASHCCGLGHETIPVNKAVEERSIVAHPFVLWTSDLRLMHAAQIERSIFSSLFLTGWDTSSFLVQVEELLDKLISLAGT